MGDSAEAHAALGRLYLATGQHSEAGAELEFAVRLNYRDVDLTLRLIWLQSTSGQDSARNGQQAVALAKQIQAAMTTDDPLILDVIAAAHAEAGDFPTAIKVARRALEVIDSNRSRLRAKIEQRLELYFKSQPFREAVGD